MSEKDVKINFKLSADFNKYVLHNPDVVKGLSSDSCIVFAEPKNPSLTQKNLKLADKIMKEERKKCYQAFKTKGVWEVKPLPA